MSGPMNLQSAAVQELRRALSFAAVGQTSLEGTSQRIVELIYSALSGEQSGTSQLALARCFVTRPFSALSAIPDLQGTAQELLGGEIPDPTHRCLLLMATRGVEPAWNTRTSSAGHKAIPLGSQLLMERTPMITELMRQLGIPREYYLNRGLLPPLSVPVRSAGCFYIPVALGSPFIPAQDRFVVPYGVRSVLGLGSTLGARDIFAVLLFFRVEISQELAQLLSQLTVSIKIGLSTVVPHLFQ